MAQEHRSGCPINLTLEVVGDKWSLLLLRDMIFGNRRHFRELLTRSEEGISSNILADRLKTLVEEGIMTKRDDPTHRQKGVYSLTEKGIELLPVQLLDEGGPALWADFMDELRVLHLGEAPRAPGKPSVFERLQAAYLEVIERNKRIDHAAL
jgi:DNA-binding HxlR family transcriptional regulator